MLEEGTTTQADVSESSEKGSLNDMLQELRILLQGAQVLTAFLIVLPFNQDFDNIHELEKWVYLATFLCSITSLVFFSAPAAHHRLVRPLVDRMLFKKFATRMIVVGLVFLSFALILVTQLVVSKVISPIVSIFVTVGVSLLILITWWLFPLAYKERL
jgi:energy-converting hydrogenase Eha subunit E